MAAGLIVVLGAAVLVLGAVLLVGLVDPRVSRARLEKFARREDLRITPENGNDVILYLAVTRRWRMAGLILSLAVALCLTLGQGRFTISTLPALIGWFAGAVVAEGRMARRRGGPRRTASLAPRRIADHLSCRVRVLPLIVLGASVLVALGLFGADLAGRPVRSLDTLLALAGAAAAVLVPAVVARQVVQRPRDGELSGDRLAADDAVRHRALRVLAGSSLALLGTPFGLLITQVAEPAPRAAAGAPGLGTVVALGLMLLGFVLATRSRSSRPAPVAVRVGAAR